jgi:hypothetical protein
VRARLAHTRRLVQQNLRLPCLDCSCSFASGGAEIARVQLRAGALRDALAAAVIQGRSLSFGAGPGTTNARVNGALADHDSVKTIMGSRRAAQLIATVVRKKSLHLMANSELLLRCQSHLLRSIVPFLICVQEMAASESGQHLGRVNTSMRPTVAKQSFGCRSFVATCAFVSFRFATGSQQ